MFELHFRHRSIYDSNSHLFCQNIYEEYCKRTHLILNNYYDILRWNNDRYAESLKNYAPIFFSDSNITTTDIDIKLDKSQPLNNNEKQISLLHHNIAFHNIIVKVRNGRTKCYYGCINFTLQVVKLHDIKNRISLNIANI